MTTKNLFMLIKSLKIFTTDCEKWDWLVIKRQQQHDGLLFVFPLIIFSVCKSMNNENETFFYVRVIYNSWTESFYESFLLGNYIKSQIIVLIVTAWKPDKLCYLRFFHCCKIALEKIYGCPTLQSVPRDINQQSHVGSWSSNKKTQKTCCSHYFSYLRAFKGTKVSENISLYFHSTFRLWFSSFLICFPNHSQKLTNVRESEILCLKIIFYVVVVCRIFERTECDLECEWISCNVFNSFSWFCDRKLILFSH